MLDKGRDIIELFSIVYVPPSPKISSAEEVRLEVERSELGPASISGYLLEGGGFIVDRDVEKKATLFIIHAFGRA
jgi:hypothetical protein